MASETAAEKAYASHLEHDSSDPKLTDEEEDDAYTIDPAAEARMLRKIDFRLIPALFLLFLLAFLDRSNIGNARIQGMTRDLRMTGRDYNIALFIFFIPYILLEVPCNILIKRMKPSTFLSAIMVLWGIATIGQGLVTNTAGLAGCRFLLGLFEAGFFPGCTYLIAMYYKRFELQRRFTFFFSASIISGSFSGLLAYAIANMDGVGGYGGWRWIFILEGLFTVIVGVASKWFVADWPEQATFLSDEEKRMLRVRLKQDGGMTRMDRLDKAARKRVFSDWKIYCGVIMYLGVVNCSYSTSFFVPTIIQELGFTAAAAQVRSIPVYVCATAGAILTAFATDYFRHRYAFCILGILIASVGEILLLVGSRVSVGVRYFAVFAVTTGTYVTQPVTLTWMQNNMGGHYKRSISSAMMVGFGNVGGVVASNIFLVEEAPRYPTGYGVSLGLLWVCAAACTVFVWGLWRENGKRERGERDYRYSSGERDNLGDDYPAFRYVY
ncbi:MFS transporter-like protein 123 [Elsinoe australis]|uniref:MFS transporter-like protein 123 n=1 Tax=Elsinoe australis TaxID=40998 RepID=A0A4U7B179_9PEZI|nr:MFS transporter-like protein 123 [Elsinoe australis]